MVSLSSLRQNHSGSPAFQNSLKVDNYLIRRNADEAGNSIWLYVGYWASQRRGGTQVHSPRNCQPAGGWEPGEASRLLIELPGRGPLTVNRYLIQIGRASCRERV